ncbi:MAG: Eco57I restriction-modification methylase domain-containing protein, partial [Gemmatimonadaceae bacterium]
LVDQDKVSGTDAETLCALTATRATGNTGDVLTHSRWLEILGREALTRRFYRALERLVVRLARDATGNATPTHRRELALLYVSRLLFLAFLETKGWLNGDHRFLENGFADCMARGGNYHPRVLLPLFFGTLNTPPRARAKRAKLFGRIPFLNGGLFARAPLERRCRDLRFTDEGIGLIFGDLLGRYRFTAREDSASWSETAIDPEMLGKVFESLMSSPERRASGSFYTPQPLVSAVTRGTLSYALSDASLPPESVELALNGDAPDPALAPLLRERITSLAVLDPACGSGAFLVHALEELASLLTRSGDPRPPETIRRALLTRSLFGVDINPTAVWLCELRLWLSVVIESEESDPLAVSPLPNLDRHIRVGDALSGDAFEYGRPLSLPGGVLLAQLRERYARASGRRKRTIERELERRERAFALAHTERELARCSAHRCDLLSALRGRDLFGDRRTPTPSERSTLADTRTRSRELRALRRSLREGAALPFSFITNFPDIATRGGFNVVLGNPPWVRLHRIPPASRESLRERYIAYRHAAWEIGAAAAHAGRGFAAQVDLAALFVERSLALLNENGTLGLLLPAKLWRSLAGGGVRSLLQERAHVVALEDWSESRAAFDASVYPMLLVAQRRTTATSTAASTTANTAANTTVEGTRPTTESTGPHTAQNGNTRTIAAALHRGTTCIRWLMPADSLSLDEDTASPWILAPPPVRSAFDRMRRVGIPLSASPLGTPLLGVKCGCNDAFIVQADEAATPRRSGEELVTVRAGDRAGPVERTLLRPLLRGEGVARWSRAPAGEHIVWTHDDDGAPLHRLPPGAAAWLAPNRRRLSARADGRGALRWWTLFRTAAAGAECARVVWADVGRSPRALILPAGDTTVPLNSCYVLPTRNDEDALAFSALLNSPLAAAWLSLLAEPARGGYRRYLAWTVALLPIPRDWPAARRRLVPLAREALAGRPPHDHELLTAVLKSFHLRRPDLSDLLEWTGR